MREDLAILALFHFAALTFMGTSVFAAGTELGLVVAILMWVFAMISTAMGCIIAVAIGVRSERGVYGSRA